MQNYRSLRELTLPLRRLTVINGVNGSGKSSLYRSLRLLADPSRNGAVTAQARDGGLPSTVWDAAGLRAALDHAFPGSAVQIDVLAGRFELTMTQRGLLRPLRSAELSDGTGSLPVLGCPPADPWTWPGR